MILYKTDIFLWWLRWDGSPIFKLGSVLPALLSLGTTIAIQELDRGKGDWLLQWEHPYAHQVFSISVTFLLTYRSQLAYQRFWEARTQLQMMSGNWCDAVMSLFIFDDQKDLKNDKMKGKSESERAEESKLYRGKLLHLVSMLHCFACLHLMRQEELEDHTYDAKEGDQKAGAKVGGGDGKAANPPTEDPSWRTVSMIHDTSCCNWRKRICFRPCLRRRVARGRNRLGVMGMASDDEMRALYPLGKKGAQFSSQKIEGMLYHNHELPCLASHRPRDKNQTYQMIHANMFDRVSLLMGWLLRLIGERRDAGGVNVPPPVLSRPYQLLSNGHAAFQGCKKIRDTPFPFPYAQLMTILLWLLAMSLPFVVTFLVPDSPGTWPGARTEGSGKVPARILSFFVVLMYCAINEVARELEVPFHVAANDLNIEELHEEFIAMLENLHVNFGTKQSADFHNSLSKRVVEHGHDTQHKELCKCVVCTRHKEKEKGEKAETGAEKAKMLFDSTTDAEESEGKQILKVRQQLEGAFLDASRPEQLSEMLTEHNVDFNLHRFQTLRLSELRRELKDQNGLLAPSQQAELECLELASYVRNLPPSARRPVLRAQEGGEGSGVGQQQGGGSNKQPLQEFVEDIDTWLLLEARHRQLERWQRCYGGMGRGPPQQQPSSAQGGGDGQLGGMITRLSRTSDSPLRNSGSRRIEPSDDHAWQVARLTGFNKFLDARLAKVRKSETSVIGRTQVALKANEDRDEALELLRLWQHVLTAKRMYRQDNEEVFADQDWLDHATIYMKMEDEEGTGNAERGNQGTSAVDKEQVPWKAMAVYGDGDDTTVQDHATHATHRRYERRYQRRYERTRLAILERHPDLSKDSAELDDLKISVYEGQQSDWQRMQDLRKELLLLRERTTASSLSVVDTPLARGENLGQSTESPANAVAQEKEEKESELSALEAIRPPLVELDPAEKKMLRALQLARFAAEVTAGSSEASATDRADGGSAAGGNFRTIIGKLSFKQQNQFRELLRIKKDEEPESKLEDNEQRWYNQLQLIILRRRVEMGELTEKNAKTWEEYEDLQLQELTDKRHHSELNDEDNVALNEVQVQVLRRGVADQTDLTLEQILQLKKLLTERQELIRNGKEYSVAPTTNGGEEKAKTSAAKEFAKADERRRAVGARSWSDEAQLEWLEMHVLQEEIKKLKETSVDGSEENTLAQQALQIQLEQATVRVLVRREQGGKDWGEADAQKLKLLRDKEKERQVKVNDENLRARITKGARAFDALADSRAQAQSTDQFSDSVQLAAAFSDDVLAQFEDAIKALDEIDKQTGGGGVGDTSLNDKELTDRLKLARLLAKLQGMEGESQQVEAQELTEMEVEEQHRSRQRLWLKVLEQGRLRATQRLQVADGLRSSIESAAEAPGSPGRQPVAEVAGQIADALASDKHERAVLELLGLPSVGAILPASPVVGLPLDLSTGSVTTAEDSCHELIVHIKVTMAAIASAVQLLKLEDLKRRQDKGLLHSAEEQQELDLLIRSCAKQFSLERTNLTEEEVVSAELRLLERKAARGDLDETEQAELERRRWKVLSAKKKAVGEQKGASAAGKAAERTEGEAVFTQIERKAYESSIVAIYSRRKRKLQEEAKTAGKLLSELRGASDVAYPDGRPKWTPDEDLDLSRYRRRELDRKSRGSELDPDEKQELYKLRCNMIDKLQVSIKQKEPAESEPEPEPECQLTKFSLSSAGMPSPSPIKSDGEARGFGAGPPLLPSPNSRSRKGVSFAADSSLSLPPTPLQSRPGMGVTWADNEPAAAAGGEQEDRGFGVATSGNNMLSDDDEDSYLQPLQPPDSSISSTPGRDESPVQLRMRASKSLGNLDLSLQRTRSLTVKAILETDLAPDKMPRILSRFGDPRGPRDVDYLKKELEQLTQELEADLKELYINGLIPTEKSDRLKRMLGEEKWEAFIKESAGSLILNTVDRTRERLTSKQGLARTYSLNVTGTPRLLPDAAAGQSRPMVPLSHQPATRTRAKSEGNLRLLPTNSAPGMTPTPRETRTPHLSRATTLQPAVLKNVHDISGLARDPSLLAMDTSAFEESTRGAAHSSAQEIDDTSDIGNAIRVEEQLGASLRQWVAEDFALEQSKDATASFNGRVARP